MGRRSLSFISKILPVPVAVQLKWKTLLARPGLASWNILNRHVLSVSCEPEQKQPKTRPDRAQKMEGQDKDKSPRMAAE